MFIAETEFLVFFRPYLHITVEKKQSLDGRSYDDAAASFFVVESFFHTKTIMADEEKVATSPSFFPSSRHWRAKWNGERFTNAVSFHLFVHACLILQWAVLFPAGATAPGVLGKRGGRGQQLAPKMQMNNNWSFFLPPPIPPAAVGGNPSD